MSIVYRGRVFAVEVARRRFPNGKEREVAIVRHNPSVVLIPIGDDGRLILIRQYRASLDRVIWEVPAGRVDDGETADHAAARECEEEIGLVPGRVERIRGLYPAPGFCDEELIFYKVSELRTPPADSPHRPDEDEDIATHAVTVADARAMVARGEIIDLKTAYSLTLI
ncbi:MAG TPA: NUDIX hydrolase [Vicinamibacterales bacterium]|nr:NUDIX hydrolase [Vicinamibacterales bacterium]